MYLSYEEATACLIPPDLVFISTQGNTYRPMNCTMYSSRVKKRYFLTRELYSI